MLSDHALQSAVARSILSEGTIDLAPLLRKGSFDPLLRFNIYRNNAMASLTATLVTVFPTTLRLLGESYFRYLAGAFIRSNPPTEPRLTRYGRTFPAFVASFEGTRTMPFVAETALLEWRIAEAFDAPTLPACSLAQLCEGRADAVPSLVLQPSLRLLVCRWPALEIWSAHQPGSELASLGRIGRRPERIALWRDRDSIRFLRLDKPRFQFLHSLMTHRNLEIAVTRVMARSPQSDLLGALGGVFDAGLVAGICRTTH